MGEIITFYSYKGGVGRTMALANVATLMSQWGYNILIVDWDLEAPGLEFFFQNHLKIGLRSVWQKEGVLDFLYKSLGGQAEILEAQNLQNCFVEITLPNGKAPLHFLTAGKRGEDYSTKVSSLDLDAFYENNGGYFIETLRNYWKQEYDFVLIDSRTGITDIGGICTIQLPDILVLLFTATEQSLQGIMNIAQKTVAARQNMPVNRLSLLCLPVPCKFDDREEFELSETWLKKFTEELSILYSDWLPVSANIIDVLKLTKIPYMSYFSFGEKLPVIEQGIINPSGLGYSYATLTSLLANKLESAEQLIENRDEYVRLAANKKEVPRREREQQAYNTIDNSRTSQTTKVSAEQGGKVNIFSSYKGSIDVKTTDRTIIIGLGGTGCDTLREIRKKIVEVYGSLERLSNVGFLYIDTDPTEIASSTTNSRAIADKENRWEVLGQSIQFNSSEYVIIDSSEVDQVVNSIDNFPQFKTWLSSEQLELIDKTSKGITGAKQIRSLGRLAFAVKMREIEQVFINKLNSLKMGRGNTQIYIITSTSGGTGSGMLFDLAYAIQGWVYNDCHLHAFLVLPELTSFRGERYLVNAYATLLELNYYSTGYGFELPNYDQPIARPPFDTCYLVGSQNSQGIQLDLKTIPEMIAYRIILSFDSSITATVQSLLNNASAAKSIVLVDPLNGNKHSQNFSTFGLSVIQFPLDQTIILTAQRLVSMMMQYWLQENSDAPVNIAEQTRVLLSTVRLSADYLLGNRDYFREQPFAQYSSEIKKFVTVLNAKLSATPSNLLAIGQQEIENYESTFRGKGILPFYQEIMQDVAGIVKVITKDIENNSSQLIENYGFDYAIKIINQMLSDLTNQKELFLENRQSCEKKALNLQKRSLPIYEKELNEAEFAFLLKKRKRQTAVTNYLEVVRAYFENKIGVQAYILGVRILDGVLVYLVDLKKRLDGCISTVERILSAFEENVQEWESFFRRKTENERKFNGRIIFAREKIDDIIKNVEVDAATRYLQEIVREEWGGFLQIVNVNIPYFSNDLTQAASRWICETNISEIFETDIAQEILSLFSGKQIRYQIFAENATKASSFLRFSRIQEHIANGKEELGGYTMLPNSIVRKIALLDDELGKRDDVLLLRRELCESSNLSPGDIETTENVNEIYFLEERAAFPLRLIEDVAILRDKYMQYIQNPSYIPVHIRFNFDPPLMDLYLEKPEKD